MLRSGWQYLPDGANEKLDELFMAIHPDSERQWRLPTAPRSVVFGEIHSVFEAALIGSGK
jgi:hypothetical protein